MTLPRPRQKFALPTLCAIALALIASAAAAQTITGTVRDAQSNTPLGSMVVAVYSSAGLLQANVTTTSTGSYNVSVSAGRYRVLAYDPAGTYATQFGADAPSFEESPEIVVAANQSVTVNFALRRGGTLSGSVLTSAGVRPGMTVAVYNLSGTRRSFTSTTSSGAYSLVVPPGSYKVVAYDDAGTLVPAFFNDQTNFAEATVVSVAGGATTSGIDLFLQLGGRAGGVVANSSGAPISGATVLVYTAAGKFVAQSATSFDGRFVFTLAPGVYRFVAVDTSFTYAAGFLGAADSFETSTAVTIAAGQQRMNLAFSLERGGLVEGRVIDAANGTGLGGMTVVAYNATGTTRTSVTTDANGAYVLLLPPGDFRIGVFDPTFAYATIFYPRENVFARATSVVPSAAQRVTLQPLTMSRGGRLSGTITDAVTHAPLAGAIVVAYDSSGDVAGLATTSIAGTYRLALAAGNYRVLAFDPQLRYATGYLAGVRDFDTTPFLPVTVGSDTTADIALTRGTLVSGTILSANVPIGGIAVTAWSMDGKRVATATSATNGTFQLPLLPGTYKFSSLDPAGRYRTSYFGGASFETAAPVTVGTTTPPSVVITLQTAGRRRAVRH